MSTSSPAPHLLVAPLTGNEDRIARIWMQAAASAARRSSSCVRARCGTVIVSDGEVIGTGVNAPPSPCPSNACFKDDLPSDFRSDRTCCTHAEQSAIYDALRTHPERVEGADLYFVRLDSAGEIAPAGEPYCTICSKAALQVGIGRFFLIHDDGVRAYDADLYNRLSFGLEVD